MLRQREWPSATVRWNRIFLKGPITTVAASFGIRKREGTSQQLTVRNVISRQAGISTPAQRTENNGNATTLDQDDITGSFSHAFRLPQSVSRSRKLIRSSLTLFVSTSQTCLRTRTEPDCAVLSDIRRREVRAGLDTDLMQILTGGFQFGYSVNEVRHLDGRTSQIFLLLSLQLSLFSGDYR